MRATAPSSDASATMTCPVCAGVFVPSGRRRYCSDRCRRTAWARHHRPPLAPIVVPGPGRPRRPITVYECAGCGTRALGEQRCDECGSFMGRVGVGGLCPACDAPVAVTDLLDEDSIRPPTVATNTDAPGRPRATRRGRADSTLTTTISRRRS